MPGCLWYFPTPLRGTALLWEGGLFHRAAASIHPLGVFSDPSLLQGGAASGAGLEFFLSARPVIWTDPPVKVLQKSTMDEESHPEVNS